MARVEDAVVVVDEAHTDDQLLAFLSEFYDAADAQLHLDALRDRLPGVIVGCALPSSFHMLDGLASGTEVDLL